MVGKRVLITGGAGFLGTSIARRLLEKQDDVAVTILDPRVPGELTALFGRQVVHDARPIAEFLKDLSSGEVFSTVIHLAWSSHPATSMMAPADDLATNVGIGIRLLERCRSLGTERFIFSSSGGTVYGVQDGDQADESHPTNPVSIYGAAKLSLEHYAQVIANRDEFDAISLRISNPYGAYQLRGVAVGSIANFLLSASQNRPITLYGDGSIVRDYISIDDVAEAFSHAVSATGIATGAYNVGSEIGTSLNDIIRLVEEVANKGFVIRRESIRSFDVPRNVLDCRRFRIATGWTPTIKLKQGIQAMWESSKGF